MLRNLPFQSFGKLWSTETYKRRIKNVRNVLYKNKKKFKVSQQDVAKLTISKVPTDTYKIKKKNF